MADNSAAAGAGAIGVVQQFLDSKHGPGQAAEVRLLACGLLLSLTTSPASCSKALRFGIVSVLRKQLAQAAPAPDESTLLCRTVTSLAQHGEGSSVRPHAPVPHTYAKAD